MARALVLGATGHIGSHIVRALLAQGHTVRAAYRSERFLYLLDELTAKSRATPAGSGGSRGIERVRVDLDTCEGLAEALEGCDWVFHAAAYYPSFRAKREAAVQRGLESIRKVLETLRRAQLQRVVFTSSVATIRRIPGRDATEADAESWPLDGWRPLYSTVKIALEHEVLGAGRAGLPVIVTNPSYCMGEYDAHPFSGLLILLFAKHRLPCYLDHRFNVVYTGDVGIGHVRAAERGRVGERYLLCHRNVTLQEFATLVARAAGVPPPRWRVPYWLVLAAAAGTELVAALTRTQPLLPRAAIHTTRWEQRLDGSKAVQELGLPQTPIDVAIHNALGWFRANGYL